MHCPLTNFVPDYSSQLVHSLRVVQEEHGYKQLLQNYRCGWIDGFCSFHLYNDDKDLKKK